MGQPLVLVTLRVAGATIWLFESALGAPGAAFAGQYLVLLELLSRGTRTHTHTSIGLFEGCWRTLGRALGGRWPVAAVVLQAQQLAPGAAFA